MTRFHRIIALAGAAALAVPAVAAGEDKMSHYRAKPSETLAQAVANFADYNAKLAAILAKDDLSVSDMERVHELTYTLEKALAKINEAMTALPHTLETLHLASEAHNAAAVRGTSRVYLETAQTVVP